jgi:hypothetical protein
MWRGEAVIIKLIADQHPIAISDDKQASLSRADHPHIAGRSSPGSHRRFIPELLDGAHSRTSLGLRAGEQTTTIQA